MGAKLRGSHDLIIWSMFLHIGTSTSWLSTVGSDNTPANGEILDSASLKIYSFAELKSATRNFRPDSVLGTGGFGTVFKGWVDENTLAPSRYGVGIIVAIKKMNPESTQGFEEWQVLQFPILFILTFVM